MTTSVTEQTNSNLAGGTWELIIKAGSYAYNEKGAQGIHRKEIYKIH
jgi:hypothetical protein